MFQGFNDFLDKYVFPWPIRFLTFRPVILLTIALLIPLIVYADNTVLVLGINSYMNVMSVAVSSIVLLYATIAEVRQKQIAELQEQRAQEDHAHIIETHNLMMRALANQHEEIEELKELLAQFHSQTYERKPVPEMPNLHELHPQGKARFEENHTRKRLTKHVKRNPLTNGVHPETVSNS